MTVEVDVVFPTLDEAKALPWILERMPEGYRAIVVDNGSVDGSADIARNLGATVIHESVKGYGAACHAGLLVATAPIVVFCDADASLDPGDIPKLVAVIENNSQDLVLGRRRPTGKGAWSLPAQLANALIAFKLRRMTGYKLTDLGALRAMRREAILSLGMEDRRSGYPLELVLRAHANKWRVIEMDAPYYPRVGKSKVTGTFRGALGAVMDMSRLLVAFDKKIRSER
jgi:glycosyltransferase involved in cell wall biosynthesis